ncbi:MAG: META domain-containing protein [Anaerolineales bacterium]
MKIKVFLIIALILLASTACQGFTPIGQDQLSGTEWVLVSINTDTDLVGSPPSLVFEGDELSGNASCNIYRGSYQVQGETLSLGPLARTEMYCQDPAGVMDQEDRYLEMLAAVDSFTLAGSSLTITGGGNILEFQFRDNIQE